MAGSEIQIDDLKPLDLGILEAMDPRLQRMVMRQNQGDAKTAGTSTSADEVVVVAKVTDLAAWEALSEVRTGLAIPGDDYTIVTARVPISRLEALRILPFVVSLKLSRPVTSSLDATTRETGAAALPAGSLAAGGSGVLVGIIDFGCDFAHRNFRRADGTTRFKAIWDQNAAPTAASPFGFGHVYSPAEINAALKAADPYVMLGYGPQPDSGGSKGTHGTHVTDIAAGNGLGSGVPGCAPQADLIFVELAADDVPWSGPDTVGKSFGDSVQLLEAVQWIVDQAGDQPCVINASLGTNGGPHDGTSLVEIGLDRLLKQKPGRAMVIAASNSFADGIHAAGTVPPGGSADVKFVVGQRDPTGNELEFWYAGADRFTAQLISPDGRPLLQAAPGTSQALKGPDGKAAVLLVNRLDDPNNHDNTIGLFLESNMPAGTWTVRLTGNTVANGQFHAWIERDDRGQSRFAAPNDNSQTLGSISCGHETIVVGSYDAHKAGVPLSFFSSSGPTRDGRQKPEVSAPGHDVLAAWSRTGTKVTRKSGTSMASPAVAGCVALVMAEAAKRGKKPTVGDLRSLVIGTARQNPPASGGWDPRYGHGRIAPAVMVGQVAAANPVAPPKPPARPAKPPKPAKPAKAPPAKKTPAAPAKKGTAVASVGSTPVRRKTVARALSYGPTSPKPTPRKGGAPKKTLKQGTAPAKVVKKAAAPAKKVSGKSAPPVAAGRRIPTFKPGKESIR